MELRADFAREDIDVLDAVAHATPGANRVSILRQILSEWAERKRHEASLILRVSGGNGRGGEMQRSGKGTPWIPAAKGHP